MAIAVGQRAVQEFPVDDRTIELFGEASTDRNPLHFDDEFGRATPFGGRIAHGMITAAFISAMIGNELPGHGSVYLGADAQVPRARAAGRHRARRGGGARLRRGPARCAPLDARVRRRHARRGRRGQGHRSRLMAALAGAAGSRSAHGGACIARDAATFERFALVLLIAMFLNIASGAFVRLTGSGLGCPDWPRCKGRPVPPLQLPPGDRVLEPHDRARGHPGRAADLPLGAPGGRPHGAPALGRRGAAHVRADPARRR